MYVNVIPRHLPVCLGECPTVEDVLRIGRVDTSGDGCWEWTAKRHVLGYGLLPDVAARRLGEQRATRAIARLLGHQIVGMHICHHCDNPPCVRPDHLFVGSAQENAADARRKGRAALPPRTQRRLERKTEKCSVCGTEFEQVLGYRPRKFCSRRCGNVARRGVLTARRAPRETRICPCGAEFTARVDSDQRLCGDPLCTARYRRLKGPRADKGMARVAREDRSCLACGSTFVALQTSTQRYCSAMRCRTVAARAARAK